MDSPEPNDATPFLPPRRSLTALRKAAGNCQGCHLWRPASGTVFGEGSARARMMLVGEQPGDREDRAGRPFVGPAGRELDRAIEAIGVERGDVYVTNVVKHFKFEERGRRRLHQTPKRFEVDACRPWLDAELAAVDPDVLVILGATAGKALLGSGFRIGAQRGRLLETDFERATVATIHPSAILRALDDAARQAERARFADDLSVAVRALSA